MQTKSVKRSNLTTIVICIVMIPYMGYLVGQFSKLNIEAMMGFKWFAIFSIWFLFVVACGATLELLEYPDLKEKTIRAKFGRFLHLVGAVILIVGFCKTQGFSALTFLPIVFIQLVQSLKYWQSTK